MSLSSGHAWQLARMRLVQTTAKRQQPRIIPSTRNGTTTTTRASCLVTRRCMATTSSSSIARRPDEDKNSNAENDAHQLTTTTTSSSVSSSSSSSSSQRHPQEYHQMLDLQASATIEGEESQIATITLQEGQTLRAESGSMIFMTPGVQMETTTGGSNGMTAAMKRLVTGQNLMVTDFTYQHPNKDNDKAVGTVALGTDFPSKIIRLQLDDYPNSTLICQKGAYLASNPSVNIEMAFAKSFTAGFFGGEGFVLQKLEGDGHVLIKAGGTLVTKELQDGETIRVSSGSLVAFTDTVDYDVQMVKGAKNAIFGVGGLFLTTLQGPGTVWLQGMPPDRMVSEIMRRMPAGGGGLGLGIPIGGSGSGGDATNDEGVVQDGGAAEDEEVDDSMAGVAATDASVDADRQAAVASSQATAATDPDSPSSLFGDAAGTASPTAAQDHATTVGDSSSSPTDAIFDDSTQTNETTFSDDGGSFGEESFSTEDSPFQEQQQDLFQDDDTSFSTFEQESSSSSSMSDAISDAAGADDDGGGGVGSVLSTIWDLFMGGDD